MEKTIITHPNFDYLWEQIAEDNWIIKVDINFWVFPDKWPNLFIKKVKTLIEKRDVTYIWDFSSPIDFFKNYAIIRWIIDYYASKVRVILPYFPVWTMERITEKWEIATARYFADVMSTLPSWREWKTSIHIFDIHALVERFLFDSHNVSVEMHTAMGLLKEELKWKKLVFPDDWAKKRFGNDFKWFETILCAKERIWKERKVRVVEGDPKWKDVIILDDIFFSWSTVLSTKEVLIEAWANSVSAFWPHWFCPKNSHINLSKNLHEFIVTDTIPVNIKRAKKIENMKVKSIKPLVEKIMFSS